MTLVVSRKRVKGHQAGLLCVRIGPKIFKAAPLNRFGLLLDLFVRPDALFGLVFAKSEHISTTDLSVLLTSMSATIVVGTLLEAC